MAEVDVAVLWEPTGMGGEAHMRTQVGAGLDLVDWALAPPLVSNTSLAMNSGIHAKT